MNSGEYAIKKKGDMTYVSKAISTKNGKIRYISKVFDLNDFKDFYNDQKNKKVYEVIRESSKQEITAIYNQDQKGFSLRIQRFAKDTGSPHNQSFSFHGGALTKFIRFLHSLDLIEFKGNQENFKVSDDEIDYLFKQRTILRKIFNSKFIDADKVLILFNKLENKEKSLLFEKFINDIDQFDIENLNAAIKQKQYKKSINDLEKLLLLEKEENFLKKVNDDLDLNKYSANQPERIFHNWIENNLWVFGSEYYKKHNFKKISHDNSEADIILETADGFISLIEIKRPKYNEKLLRYDSSHRSYFPTSHFSEAIGQCLVYLKRLEEFKKELESEHQVKVLRPRINLIIGRTNNFNTDERDTLKFLNSSLFNVDVLSYDQLVENGKKIISFYDC